MVLVIAVLLISFFASPAPAASPAPKTAPLPERCLLKPDPLPCKAYMQMYYYDPGKGRCVFFGGCSDVVPFQKLEECKAACETKNSKNSSEISKDEYAILEAVLKNVGVGGWHVKETTIARQLKEATVAFLNEPPAPEEGMKIDASIVADFNAKNREEHRLSRDFIVERDASMYRTSGGSTTISLSRAGFDAEQKRAVVFLRDTYLFPPEAFVESDYFILLQRTGNTWKVIKKIKTGMKYS